MPLQVLFGDDEHTGADGPYSRLMKTRKWLYITTAAGLLLHLNLVDAGAIGRLLQVVGLPIWLLKKAVAAALIYLSVVYGSLILQLLTTYDLVIDERFVERREEELKNARQRMLDAQSEAQRFRANFRVLSDRMTEAEESYDLAMQEWEADPDRDETVEPVPVDLSDLKQARGTLRRFEAEAARTASEFDRLLKANPRNRKFYLNLERFIDAWRIVPAIVFALAVGVPLLRSI